nr:unnamed protein product [Digitaria exilis]
MVLQRFSWPYPAGQASFCGSFTGWREYPMALVGAEFQVVFDLPPGVYQVKDSDNLVDVALTIIRNEISSVPIFKSMPDSSGMPLLNLATLQGILKFLCLKLQEQAEGYSLLHNQLINIPIGTWAPHTGRTSNRQLRTLRLSSPLNSCLDFLLQDRVSSIPIVDDNGSLRDVYSLRFAYCSICFCLLLSCYVIVEANWLLPDFDIMALAKNDVYARIELEQVTVQNVIHCPLFFILASAPGGEALMNPALDVQYQVQGRRQCHTCLQTSTLLEVLQELSIPGTSLCDLYS